MPAFSLPSSITLPAFARLSLSEHAQSLGRHLRQCDAARSRLFGAASLAELAHGVVAPRFVTTVSLAALLLALCSAFV